MNRPNLRTHSPVDVTGAISPGLIVRFFGIAVVVFGLVIAYQVVEAAWGLFDDQQLVVRLTDKINEQTNLDVAISSTVMDARVQTILTKLAGDSSSEPSKEIMAEGITPKSSAHKQKDRLQNTDETLKVSYFVAWSLTIILLGMIAKIAFWAMTSGAKMCLYGTDHQNELKNLLKQIINEKS